MTVLHTGWTKKFGTGWDSIFGGKRKASAGKPKAAQAKAGAKKKSAKKKTRKAAKGKR